MQLPKYKISFEISKEGRRTMVLYERRFYIFWSYVQTEFIPIQAKNLEHGVTEMFNTILGRITIENEKQINNSEWKKRSLILLNINGKMVYTPL